MGLAVTHNGKPDTCHDVFDDTVIVAVPPADGMFDQLVGDTDNTGATTVAVLVTDTSAQLAFTAVARTVT